MDIEEFKSNVTSIQRATLYEVEITGPAITGAFSTQKLKFTCKAASMPSSTFGVIEVPYMGRKIKFDGDRQYQEWQTTVIIDNKWEIYQSILNWHESMNGPKSNISTTENMNNKKGVGVVRMLSTTGKVNYAVKLVGLFPHDLQQIDLAWDQNDTTADLNVSWSYDYVVRI